MKVILFGATGMVGQGVLRECLLDPGVESALVIGRSATGQQHEKLCEIMHKNLFDFSTIEGNLAGYDAARCSQASTRESGYQCHSLIEPRHHESANDFGRRSACSAAITVAWSLG